jgi:hypothetical protein
MYRYYSNAEVCLVWLSDISRPLSGGNLAQFELVGAAFETCRWAKHGWTLQELIARASCRFCFQNWTLMGTKADLLEELSQGTGILCSVLKDRTIQRGLTDCEERFGYVCM